MQCPRAIQFGAGAIGRGFIGALLGKSGYHITFADVNEALLDAINTYGSYTIRVLLPDGTIEPQVSASSISGCNSNSDKILEEIVAADVITTAVGPDILRFVAPTIARGLSRRRKQREEDRLAGRDPDATSDYINVIACENRVGASELLQEMVMKCLRDEEDKRYVETYVGFANCSVDRIVPPVPCSPTPPSPSVATAEYSSDSESDAGSGSRATSSPSKQHYQHTRSSLDVGVEPFYEWIVDKTKLKGNPPFPVPIQGMQLTDRLCAYHQRKLFTLNTGHAMTAYLGHLKGYHTIDQAIRDAEIGRNVCHAMRESGAGLCKKFAFDHKAHAAYIETILGRFRNPHLRDECARVGREPLRKLGMNDRFVGPARLCKGFGLWNKHLCRGIAAAMRYDNPEDQQSREVLERVKKEGVRKVAMELTGWTEDDVEIEWVEWNYEHLENMTRGRHPPE